MRKWFIIISITVIALATVGFFVLRNGRSASNKERVYFFYPKTNVYYDSSEARFVFQDSTGKWDEHVKLPPSLEQNGGKKVRIIGMPGLWEQNQYHRLVYSVALYKSPNDLKETVVISKTSKTSRTKPDSTEESSEKTGIEGFFDKLFNGKKKKTDTTQEQ